MRSSTSSFCGDNCSLFTRQTPLRSLKLHARVATRASASQTAPHVQKRYVAASNGVRSQNPIQLLIAPKFWLGPRLIGAGGTPPRGRSPKQAPAARFLRARAATGPCGPGPRGEPAPLRVGRAAAPQTWSKNPILEARGAARRLREGRCGPGVAQYARPPAPINLGPFWLALGPIISSYPPLLLSSPRVC